MTKTVLARSAWHIPFGKCFDRPSEDYPCYIVIGRGSALGNVSEISSVLKSQGIPIRKLPSKINTSRTIFLLKREEMDYLSLVFEKYNPYKDGPVNHILFHGEF